jgi:AcrR family transcriptional regulator
MGGTGVTRGRVDRELTDGLILDAIVAEINEAGVDALGPTAVARRAGFTTGAVYSRYEDTVEIAVDAWSRRCASACHAYLDDGVSCLLDGFDDSTGLPDGTGSELVDRLVAQILAPPPELSAGIELMVAARREDGIGEVVLPDLMAWLQDWLDNDGGGLADDGFAGSPERRAKVGVVLSVLFGLQLLGQRLVAPAPDGAGSDAPDLSWRAVVTVVHTLLRGNIDTNSLPELDRRPLPTVPPAEELDDDPTRGRLMAASIGVIARVGVARATATRIARRAGLSHGAIYGTFEAKEDLVSVTVQRLTTYLMAADRAYHRAGIANGRGYPELVASMFNQYRSPERSQWRRFRLEAHLAARHDPRVAAAVESAIGEAIDDDASILQDTYGQDAAFAQAMSRFQSAGPLGLIMVDALLGPFADTVDWRMALLLLG